MNKTEKQWKVHARSRGDNDFPEHVLRHRVSLMQILNESLRNAKFTESASCVLEAITFIKFSTSVEQFFFSQFNFRFAGARNLGVLQVAVKITRSDDFLAHHNASLFCAFKSRSQTVFGSTSTRKWLCYIVWSCRASAGTM